MAKQKFIFGFGVSLEQSQSQMITTNIVVANHLKNSCKSDTYLFFLLLINIIKKMKHLRLQAVLHKLFDLYA